MAATDPRSTSDGGPASRGGFPGGESSNDRDGTGGGDGGSGDGERDRATFECNICLDTAKDAVISMCGHLFWYDTRQEKGWILRFGSDCYCLCSVLQSDLWFGVFAAYLS